MPPGQVTDIFSGGPKLIYAEVRTPLDAAIYSETSTPEANRYSYISSGTLVTDADGAISAWGFSIAAHLIGMWGNAVSFSLPGDVSVDKAFYGTDDNSFFTIFNYNKPGTWYVTLVPLWPAPAVVVPEPAAMALCLAGLATLGAVGQRRRAKRTPASKDA